MGNNESSVSRIPVETILVNFSISNAPERVHFSEETT